MVSDDSRREFEDAIYEKFDLDEDDNEVECEELMDKITAELDLENIAETKFDDYIESQFDEIRDLDVIAESKTFYHDGAWSWHLLDDGKNGVIASKNMVDSIRKCTTREAGPERRT